MAASVVVEGFEQRRLMSAVPVNTGSLLYTQNFDSATVPSGWVLKEVGTAARADGLASTDNGGSNAGDTYLYGSDNSDRAFGTLLSGTNTPTIGAVFRNDTGQLITQATIKYNGEMWRLGQANRGADSLNFGYQVVSGTEPNDPTVGMFTAVPALNFNSPVTTGAVGALNGNVAPNRTDNITAALPGLSWAPGAYLFIRWTDTNASGSDDGLAVDDFSLTVSGINAGGPGAITIDPSSKTVNENAGTVSFAVNRVGGTQGTISADILVNDGTAVAGDDYGQPNLNTVTFADGSNIAQTITIPIYDDSKYELAEQFTVGLTNAQGTNGTPQLGNAATVTITDNDTPFYKNSFETNPGTGYTLIGTTGDHIDNSSGSNVYSYFGRFASPDTAAIGRKDFTSGFDGSFAVQGQFHSADAFGEGADPLRTIELDPINIAGKTDLTAYLSLGADSAEPAYQDWKNTDGISIYATLDGGDKVLIGQFKTSDVKGDLKLDTNLDGIGDGPTLHAGSLQDYAFNIPGVGNSLKLDVEVTSTAGFQAWAVDNVRVDGIQSTVALPAWVGAGSAATWDAGTHTLTVSGVTSIVADPGTDAANIIASGSGAILTFNPTTGQAIHLAGLTLDSGAKASVASIGSGRSASNHRVLVISNPAQFSVTGGAQLDLNDNDMIIKNGNANAIEDLTLQARDVAAGGAWDGTGGITSSAAKAQFNSNGFEVTALGVLRNGDNFNGSVTSFAGETVTDNDVLVKYTYAGDFTLDGKVDGDDAGVFGLFYDGGSSTGHRWIDGDLNGDGRVDDTDAGFVGLIFGNGTADSSNVQL